MTCALQVKIKYFLLVTYGVTIQMRVTVFQRSIISLLILVRIIALVLMIVFTSLIRICAPGFTDEKCGTNIDNCLCNNNPCQNNGTCVDLLLLLYTCIWLEGYTGKDCSIKLHYSFNSCQKMKFVLIQKLITSVLV